MSAFGNLTLVPVLGPLLLAAALLLIERRRPSWQAPLALAGTFALVLFAWRLLELTGASESGVYLVGNWRAPYGIVLVADRLAALMVLLAALVGLACLCAAWHGAAQGPHFHAFFQVQLAGVNGAFLTGDLFNLFVFFEVLLAASYALLLHGAGGRALRAGLHYVVVNMVGSALFLVAASLLYGVAGTLNLADLAVKLPSLPETDAPLAQAAVLLLLVVFGVKAALLPLGFWLPETYGSAPGPVAALFAILSKVGLYGIVRVSTLFFGVVAGPEALWSATALLALGLVTLAFGALAALAAARLTALVAGLVLASTGTLAVALALGADVLGGALYYLVHSTLAIALAFLLAHAITAQRGALGDRLSTGVPVAQPVLLGGLFLVAGAAVAGLPPLPGFIGKVLMLQGSAGAPHGAWFWGVLLASGLVAAFALARAGSRVFWKTRGAASAVRAEAGVLVGIGVLAVALAAWTIAAGPAVRFATATARQLADAEGYVRAVLQREPAPPAAKARP